MKVNILNKLFLLTICIVFFSCKSKKAAITSSEIKIQPLVETKKELNTIITHETQFSTFTTKAATLLNLNGKEYDVTLNIRIKKAEAIWISITAIAGLEVSRILITPDSLKIMDRINNEYLKKSFSFIHGFTNEKIDYQTLESLLIGNCIPFTLNTNSEIKIVDGILNLNGEKNSLTYLLQFNSQYKATHTFLTDIITQQSLTVNTPSFEEISNQFIPNKLSINSKTNQKQFKVEMEYNKTQLNIPLDFPFNVPNRFSVIE